MSSERQTLYFVDSSSVDEIRELKEKSGLVSGVTTNPTSISSSLPEGLSEDVALDKYIERVVEINEVIPGGPISLQVPVDFRSTSETIVEKSYNIYQQVPKDVNVFLKLPCIKSALEAGSILCKEKIPLNFTLVFAQVQLAAIHIMTSGADPDKVFASAFIRRMYNPPINPATNLSALPPSNGMDLVENGCKLLRKYDSHVNFLAASIGDKEDIMGATFYGADIITIPYKPFMEWVKAGLPMPDENYFYVPKSENRLRFEDFDLNATNLNKIPSIKHILTQLGLETFNMDWYKSIKRN